ncbi:MAG: hypothetical protein IKL97_02115 [Eggerthellaceae bacterium]|nr:hypothetical protein [Eggerthellaceae bacterium]
MLMSTERYMDEEFEKVCAQEQFANIDYLWLFEGGAKISLTERFVDKAAAEVAKANPPRPFTFKGEDDAAAPAKQPEKPAANMLYTVCAAEDAQLSIAGKIHLRREAYDQPALEAIEQAAAEHCVSAFYKREHGGHVEGFVEGGEGFTFAIENYQIIVEEGQFKGVLLNWIGAAHGSWWNGINQCALMVDGAAIGADQGSYSFDYDDSAYYGYDGWKVSLQLAKRAAE